MEQAQQIAILHKLFARIENHENEDAGVQVKNPTTAYVSPELAKKEWRAFFRDHAQIVGLSGDLPEVGSYRTLDDFGVPVLLTRDKAKRFRAFVNACRHRGTQVVTNERGNAKRFVCPFHGWTYTPEGQLFAVPEAQQFGEVDHSCLGLVELPSVERFGLLWVHPDPKGNIDIGELMAGLENEFESWDVSHHVWRANCSISKRMNWKIANDTFGETYHFARLHRQTLNNLFHGDVIDYQPYGPNHRLVFPSRGIHALKKKSEDRWSLENATTVLYFLFPNIQITVSRRQVTLFRIYPDPHDHARSTTQVSHYFSQAALDEMHSGEKTIIHAGNVYDPQARDGNAVVSPEAAMEVLDSTLEQEDYQMAELTQRAAESGALEFLIFGRNEPALHHFHNSYRKALGEPPLERL
ncbi:MAG: aromatic ring-hydroxylating dioxygenase subunit alpha [Pseudomonadota bacterium]